jgi:BirA family transcriptional regulator, biotin operon repressor / biotin---[acetyl-CoA-carboxylase] ligase
VRKENVSSLWGAPIYHLQTVGSTNSTLLEAGEAGAPHGTVLYADEQSQGRGQFLRKWDSPRGKGLWFSLLLRPQISITEISAIIPLLSRFAAIALTDLFLGLDIDPNIIIIKAPNDLLLDGKKVAGILVETRLSRQELEILPQKKEHVSSDSFAVVGIGLNLFQQEIDFPKELQEKATSLLQQHPQLVLSRLQILEQLLHALWYRYQEFQTHPEKQEAIWDHYKTKRTGYN